MTSFGAEECKFARPARILLVLNQAPGIKSCMRFHGFLLSRLGKRFALATAAVFMIWSCSSVRAEEARLLRFPAIHGDQIAFSYAGDLFTVSAAGGVARRLTSDVGYEMFAR